MLSAATLHRMTRKGLMDLLLSGHAIDPTDLDDTVYNGVSLGLPHLVERVTWKKFQKTFYRDPSSGLLRGWNVRIVDDGLDRPWRPKLRRGEPMTFGHYQVVDARGQRMPRHIERGLLIDYGRGTGRLSAVGRMRDPIVAVNAGSAELLLGWTYVDFGIAQLGTPSFFSLQRGEPLNNDALTMRHCEKQRSQ